ncbi:RNA-directed DNA polymerase [Falsiroseomonas tokyonensis]|uniref:RNA-directed DNA polymerase n=1 Tax=Falsiroseomonas tokyonensis TaxID=430521 RepID=A0ABV7BVC7_9PROT|nr:RNA-directed DNA polymerase [Falsiroseomonas tokyonensis]MBU8539466.1 RNA-directed DNA polymerase [Falsiroseomonas tokyonensis]
MKLKKASLEWAIKHIISEGDTDLLPLPFEFNVINEYSARAVKSLSNVDINAHNWSSPRRFLIPKRELSFRAVLQLEPFDAILFAALIYEIGRSLERRRRPVRENSVFSNRFSPSKGGRMYALDNGWEEFWKRSLELASKGKHVLVTDISDFYNQIYHHTIENQIDEAVKNKEHLHAIKNFLSRCTDGVSRGVPVGPHGTHILAEMALIPLDNFMLGQGYQFCRYADDLHVFADSHREAQKALYSIVGYLDNTQKIQLNRQKTAIIESTTFARVARSKSESDPINDAERDLVAAVRSLSSSPYRRISPAKIKTAEMEFFSKPKIEGILKSYISEKDIDYIRLRWVIRRLAQAGMPGGVDFIMRNFEIFIPALAEVANYFESCAGKYDGEWREVGAQFLRLAEDDLVASNEYLRALFINLFGRIKKLNHVNELTKLFQEERSPSVRREIVTAAARAKAADWFRIVKGEYLNADPWLRRAIIHGGVALPKDERTAWLKGVKRKATDLEQLLVLAIE